MLMTARLLPLLVIFAIGGCAGDSGAPLGTGLTGVVLRGPTQPVCQVDDPCEDEPFAATFDVYRGSARITGFRSDTQGAFAVGLSPGSYRVVPRADAPIIDPSGQAKDVEVGAAGLTTVTLSFDTGIR